MPERAPVGRAHPDRDPRPVPPTPGPPRAGPDDVVSGPVVEPATSRPRGARSKARRRALDVLYEAEARREPALHVLERAASAAAARGEVLHAHASRLVQGVSDHRAALEALVDDRAVGWELDRMPAVDRAVLLLGAFELLGCPDVPRPVALSEAVDLADEMSTEASARFVNGLLSRLADEAPPLPGAPAPGPGGDPSGLDDATSLEGASGLDGPAGVGLHDAPGDQPVGQLGQ